MNSKNSLFDLANAAYQNGEFEKAFNLFLKSSEDGDASSMGRHAMMYADGEGVDCDIDKSIYWDLKAINAGNVTSMGNLAITYRTKGDIVKAREYFQSAVEAGDADAALDLAKLYMISDKEIDTVKKYLDYVVNSDTACESSVEEAKLLLKKCFKS